MQYLDLDKYWQRVFFLEWQSLCEKSKAIAALIVDDNGEIISEGRNKIGETEILEPCPMCMETMVMGGLRSIVIGAHDDHGGAMNLIDHSKFLKDKNIKIKWMPEIYGDIQRGLQAIKELLYNENEQKLQSMLTDF